MEGTRSYEGLKATELRLGLPGTDVEPKNPARGVKRAPEEEGNDDGRPRTKSPAQAVGWPPVRSCWKNGAVRARKTEDEAGGTLLKVSMDGAPYLRKIDLKMYKGYKELREALENLFRCFSLSDHYAITYEDKDGDWMLVGDVPWRMFSSSCKRLRIINERV